MTPPTTPESQPPNISLDYFLQNIVVVNEIAGRTASDDLDKKETMPPPLYLSKENLPGNLYLVNGSAVGTLSDPGKETMTPPTKGQIPPPYLSKENLPGNLYLVNGSAVGTLSDAGKKTVTPPTKGQIPPPYLSKENLPGNLYLVNGSAVGTLSDAGKETMTPPTKGQIPPPYLSKENLSGNLYLVNGSAVGTVTDANKKETMTPPTKGQIPPPYLSKENVPGNLYLVNGSAVGTLSDAGKETMTPPTKGQIPPPYLSKENLSGNLYLVNGSAVGTVTDANKKETMTPPTKGQIPPPYLSKENVPGNLYLVNGSAVGTVTDANKKETMTPPTKMQIPRPYLSMEILPNKLFLVNGSPVGTITDAGNKKTMTPPTTMQNPPPYLSMENWPGNLHLKASVSAVRKGTMTQKKAVPKPCPNLILTMARSEFYGANPLVIPCMTVVGADKKKTMTQEAVQNPPHVPMVERDPRDVNIFKEIPMIEKGSVLGANKQKVNVNSETKIDLDEHVKRGKRLVVSGVSGNLLLSSTKTVKCTREEAKKKTLKMRGDFFTHRLLLNVINLGMQIGNLCALHDVAASIVNPEPRLAKFMEMRFRYFTTWVVMLHVFYSGTDLTLIVYQHNEKMRTGTLNVLPIMEKPKYLIEGLFRCILWPSSLVTTVFFWTLFTYDRELIFPEFVDKLIWWGPNHVLHTWISIFVILDVLFRPRLRPLSYIPNLRIMVIFLFVYMIVFYYTVIAEGTWLYPIFSIVYESGVTNFIFLHLLLLTLFIVYYILLWNVNDRFHKHRQYLKRKTRYFQLSWGPESVEKLIKGKADLARIRATAQ